MDNATVNSDHEVRLRALSPLHSFVVQAPAGSGKTELLAQRYLRLLATVQQPEHILAITFTRKAASEMGNRILQALRFATESPKPEQSHKAQTWELARAVLVADQKHHWQLLSHPSRLRIQTIDALNAGLARRLPILSGTGAAFEITNDAEAIYTSTALRLLEQLGDGSAIAVALAVVLNHVANRVPALIDMLCDLLARRDHWLPLLKQHDQQSLRNSMETTLRAAIEHHLQLLQDSIPSELHGELVELCAYSAKNRLANNVNAENQSILESCSNLTALPGHSHTDIFAWRGLATVACKKEGDFYSSVTKTQGFPTDNKDAKHRFEALLNALRDISGLAELFSGTHALPSATYSESQWEVLAALLHVLPQAVAHLKIEFQQHARVDFVELALRARDALGSEDSPTDLALTMDLRLQHILVDEFQDTSITQMKLLNLLTAGWNRGDGRTLFCVGDPMQSIYRFRQAEVGLFLAMQQHGLPNVAMESLQLRTNFRSTHPVINWINGQFPSVLPAHNDSEQGAVSYSHSICHENAESTGGVYVHAAIDRTPQQEAEAVVTVVNRVLSNNAKRIAILVGGRSHVTPIARALANANVAFNAVDIESLKDRSLIQDLLALTRALLHPGDRTAWLACLRAPWCGLTLTELHTLAGDHPDATIWSLLSNPVFIQSLHSDALLRTQRFNVVIQAALNERGRHSLRDWVERCWLALAGPALLDNVNELHDANAYFTHLDEIEVAGDLPDIAQLESRLDKLYAAPGNSRDARVEIMTIHKSKGLEFDVVIIPSLHRTGQQDKSQLLRWAQLTGLDVDGMTADGLVLSPPQARGNDGDSIYEWLKQLEQRRTELERGRLLYVAATRAKSELHLFGSASMDSKDEKIKPPRKGTMLSLLWHAVAHEFEHGTENKPSLAALAPSTAMLRRLPLSWQPPAISSAVTEPSIQESTVETDAPLAFDWASETARHVGTVVHAELEKLMNIPLQQRLEWNPASRRSIILLMLAEQGVPDELRGTACDRVVRAVDNTLTDKIGRWIIGMDDTIHDADTELALSGIVSGTVVNCVMDRTFVDEAGVRWIIDFKTSTHEGGERETFLESEEQRYRHQLQRYATLMRAWKPDQPIKTALYFPLLSVWRELK